MNILAISPASVTSINRSIYVKLKERGWSIHLVIPEIHPVASGPGLSAAPAREVDPPIHFMKMKGSNQRVFFFPEMENLFRKISPRVVVIESDPVSYMAVHVGNLCARYGAALFTLSCENLSFDVLQTFRRRGIKSIPGSFLKKALYLLAKRHIHTVFTISDAGTKLFIEKGFPRVVKIPLGFDPSIFYVDESKRKQLRSSLSINAPVIAYFGRIVAEKGTALILHALNRIKHLKWHFFLDHFGPEASAYHRQIHDLIDAYELSDRVIYVKANHVEIASYMNAADIVIVPSLSTPKWKEQYGRVVPEAMACGKVVVISNSGTLPELIGESGISFPEGDLNALTSVLLQYLTAPENYDGLSRKAAQHARSYFSIESQATIYEKNFLALGLKPEW